MKQSLIVITLLLTAAATAYADDPPAEPVTFEDRYGTLLTHNLFHKERRPPPPKRTDEAPPEREETPPPPAVPEKDFRLVGIVFENEAFRAYFEDLKQKRIVRVAAGETIATGVVSEIFIDALSFTNENGVVWVDFGDDLTGASAAAMERAEKPAPDAYEEARQNQPRGGSETREAMLERLRARRAAAQGGGR